MSVAISAAGRTKRRGRPPSAEVAQRRAIVADLAREGAPCSVRNVYYRAVVAGLVPKNEHGYESVQRDLAYLRREGLVPFEWVVDHTRLVRRPRVFDGIESALAHTAQTYRRDLWTYADVRVEVWAESQSVGSVVAEVTERWALPLCTTRGFSSLSFAHSAARSANADGRPLVVIYIGDHDPAGLRIEDSLRHTLESYLTVPLHMDRIAVTWDQVEALDLPGTKPKRPYGFPLAVEAEAMPAPMLRQLLDDEIATYADPDTLAVLLAAEQSEREVMRTMRMGGVS